MVLDLTVIELRCFIAVAKQLSYMKAAKSLYISQPAVSRHIISLEKELGTVLLNRNKQYVSLTAAGTRFLSEAEDIIERIDLAKYNVQNNIGNEVLNVGCVSSIQIHGLSAIYRAFHAVCPDVTISNTEISALDYRRVSVGDHLDIAFVPGGVAYDSQFSSASLIYHRLYKGQLVCVLPKGHPLALKESVILDDLAGETLILLDHDHCPPEMDEIQLMIRRNGKNLKYFFSGSSLYTIPMIDAGLGIAVMSDFVCPPQENLVTVPFQIKQPVEYGMIYRANDKSERVQHFSRIARAYYAHNTKE